MLILTLAGLELFAAIILNLIAALPDRYTVLLTQKISIVYIIDTKATGTCERSSCLTRTRRF